MVGLIDGGLVLLLPETKGKTLPETIEDAENMHRYSTIQPERNLYQTFLTKSASKQHFIVHPWKDLLLVFFAAPEMQKTAGTV